MARVLVVNAGSSSLKLSLLQEGTDAPVATTELELTDAQIDRAALSAALACGLSAADCTAHRLVHGGSRFRSAVLVDGSVRSALDALVELAPLHMPAGLAALDAVVRELPDRPAVACFDTGFHATLPPAAVEYALPLEWRSRWGLRRFGFHGLSHAYIARRVGELLGRAGLRIVSCHLGSGASLCAIDADGQSVDTTMGFTPLEGLVMGTRPGNVDPGMLVWLLSQAGVTVEQLSHALEHESGLVGLAGVASMRSVLEARASGDARARLAVDVYLHRLRAGIAAMAASLGGVDVVAFTGGVGEHSASIRDEAVAGLRFLGAFEVLCIPAREDLEMARQARVVLAEAG